MRTGVELPGLEGRLGTRGGKAESLARNHSQRRETNGEAQA